MDTRAYERGSQVGVGNAISRNKISDLGYRKLTIMKKGFEQIISWKRARSLNKEIYKLTEQVAFSKDFALRDQIRRASISISSNIAEGYGRKTDKEFIYFLNVAQASCYEVKSQLYLAMDIEYLNQTEFEKAHGICDEISKTIYGLIKHLENKI